MPHFAVGFLFQETLNLLNGDLYITNQSKIMNNIYQLYKKTISSAVVFLFLSCSLGVRAECNYFDNFKDNGNGTVTDPRNGWIWKRCIEGYKFEKNSCVITSEGLEHDGINLFWEQSMEYAKKHKFIGKNDWRLPTKDEYLAILGDEAGCKGVFNPASKMISHLSHHDNSVVGAVLWTTSPVEGEPEKVWAASFEKSSVSTNFRTNGGLMVLVRSSKKSDATEFESENNKFQHYKNLKNINSCKKIYVGAQLATTENDYDFLVKITGVSPIQGVASGVLGCTVKGWCGHTRTNQMKEASCDSFFRP